MTEAPAPKTPTSTFLEIVEEEGAFIGQGKLAPHSSGIYVARYRYRYPYSEISRLLHEKMGVDVTPQEVHRWLRRHKAALDVEHGHLLKGTLPADAKLRKRGALKAEAQPENVPAVETTPAQGNPVFGKSKGAKFSEFGT